MPLAIFFLMSDSSRSGTESNNDFTELFMDSETDLGVGFALTFCKSNSSIYF